MAFRRARAVSEMLPDGHRPHVDPHHKRVIPEHGCGQCYLLRLTSGVEAKAGNDDRSDVDASGGGLDGLEDGLDERRHQRGVPWYEVVNQPAHQWTDEYAEHADKSEKTDVESGSGGVT